MGQYHGILIFSRRVHEVWMGERVFFLRRCIFRCFCFSDDSIKWMGRRPNFDHRCKARVHKVRLGLYYIFSEPTSPSAPFRRSTTTSTLG